MSDAAALQRRYLLSLCVWREGRGEPPEGQELIAQTVKNRVNDPRWPNTYTGVILQPRQFSAFTAGDPNATKFPLSETDPAWVSCVDAADLVLSGRGPLGDMNHYHAIGIWPDWADKSKEVARCNRHIFYRL